MKHMRHLSTCQLRLAELSQVDPRARRWLHRSARSRYDKITRSSEERSGTQLWDEATFAWAEATELRRCWMGNRREGLLSRNRGAAISASRNRIFQIRQHPTKFFNNLLTILQNAVCQCIEFRSGEYPGLPAKYTDFSSRRYLNFPASLRRESVLGLESA